MNKAVLLIIDPQNDFIKEDGALKVTGAESDMKRLSDLIKRVDFDSIIVTLDTHEKEHIASNLFWVDSKGQHPKEFTNISYEDIINGSYKPLYRINESIDYLKQLKIKNKKHILWPQHSIKGSYGWKIYEPIESAVNSWEIKNNKKAILYLKGDGYITTEMLSAVHPEIVVDKQKDAKDTKIFMSYLENSNKIYIAGEAMDFCILHTVKDLIEENKKLASKLHIITDCTSAINPLSEENRLFWADMTKNGVTLTTSKEILKL